MKVGDWVTFVDLPRHRLVRSTIVMVQCDARGVLAAFGIDFPQPPFSRWFYPDEEGIYWMRERIGDSTSAATALLAAAALADGVEAA